MILPAKKMLNGLAYWLRDLYWETPWLQSTYSAEQHLQALASHARGDLYGALGAHCNAARRVRSVSLRRKRLAQFEDLVRATLKASPPATLNDNVFIRQFLKSKESEGFRSRLKGLSREDRVSIRKNVIVLKAPRNHERGVLLLKYTQHFKSFLVNYNLAKVCERFSIVLEPSWYPYPEPHWAMFNCANTTVVCETISVEAAEAMQSCGLPLVPIAIGAQDWVDPDTFFPQAGVEKDFDVVMIASFQRLKRHGLLFAALGKLRPRRLRVALIGRTWERTREEFERQLRNSGIQDVTIFQGLNGSEINTVLNRSKVKVLLSKVEGGNVALMEAMAANVPCVVYKDIVGPRLTDFNEMTGALTSDDRLHEVMARTIDNHERFHARDWFLQNTGYRVATQKLNALLRSEAIRRGEPWTVDIVPKVNRLGLRYVSESDSEQMKPAWSELEDMLVGL